MTHYYIPQTIFPVRIPASEYAELVSQIPAGYVTTSKEIEMFLAHRPSAEAVEYDGPLPKFVNPNTGDVSVLPEEGMEQSPSTESSLSVATFRKRVPTARKWLWKGFVPKAMK